MASPSAPAHERRNLAVLIAHVVVIRTAWIFKTESVVIPAFLDQLGGAGWLRGLLPILNRLGQSVPPFLLARRVKISRRKRTLLFASTLGMAVPFALLSVLIASDVLTSGALAALFLGLYVLFFSAVGLSNLAMGTLQGKLIRPDRRGLLLALGTLGGTIPAIGFAFWLLPDWLAAPGGYALVFGFCGVGFALGALVALGLREEPDRWVEAARPLYEELRGALEILRTDHNYRRLVVVHALFTTSLILLPHYQSLARERLGLAGGDMMEWVVAQNAAVGLGAVFVGPLADRAGNRLALRTVVLFSSIVPLGALALASLEPELGRSLFTAVFVGIGWTPIAFRLTANYILEIAPEEEHARYLAISPVCTAAVLLSSPLFGAAIDGLGYEPVFLVVAVLVATGGVLTFGLSDPRARARR